MKSIIFVKKSPLGGYGVFATENIGKGRRIGRWVGKRTNRNSKYVNWMEFPEGFRGYLGRGRLKFLNHSDKHNSEFNGLELFAIKSIRKGAEITIDYGDEYEWNDKHPKRS